MNSEDNIYQKCGEIYFSNENYTFLCYYCNNLFYEFDEFKTHTLLHEDVFDLSEEINFIESDNDDNKSIKTNLIKRSYDEPLTIICDDDVKSDKKLFNIDDCDEDLKLELLNNIDDCDEDLKIDKELLNNIDNCDKDLKSEKEYLDNIDDCDPLYGDKELLDGNYELQDNKTESNISSVETIKNETFKGFNDNKLHNKTKLTISSVETIQIEAVNNFDENVSLNGSNENIFCKHCKIFVKTDLHDFKKCFKIQQTIITYKGDFIKLLRLGILCCSYCKRYFDDYKKLYEHHIVTKHCIHKNQCKICKFFKFMNNKIQSSKDVYNLSDCENENRNEIQESPSKINCEQSSCHSQNDLESKNTYQATISNDSETDTSDKLKCKICEKVFKTKYQKQIHMRIHTNDRPYKCELCSAAFTVATNLKNHIVYKHTEERPYVCDYKDCNVKFKLLNLKKQHEKLHLPANFQCEKCGNYFKSKFILQKHQQSIHVDSKNWTNKCEICDKRFAHREYLVEHIRTHTGEKPFGCDICSKYFRKRSSLREHKKLHSSTKKYVCGFCGKAFKQIAGYWSHVKRHPRLQ